MTSVYSVNASFCISNIYLLAATSKRKQQIDNEIDVLEMFLSVHTDGHAACIRQTTDRTKHTQESKGERRAGNHTFNFS
jgi:hypothetical protein